jgi:hypothetical protein
MHGWDKKLHTGFKNENLKERHQMLDQGIDGTKVKWLLKQ